mmetsp:Transcript_35980/g.112111  ORF Transcript_35980/g.112111 Transcript_35980/m.112111 type:complete len:269 (-) Transcript_35980:173-979(-)
MTMSSLSSHCCLSKVRHSCSWKSCRDSVVGTTTEIRRSSGGVRRGSLPGAGRRLTGMAAGLKVPWVCRKRKTSRRAQVSWPGGRSNRPLALPRSLCSSSSPRAAAGRFMGEVDDEDLVGSCQNARASRRAKAAPSSFVSGSKCTCWEEHCSSKSLVELSNQTARCFRRSRTSHLDRLAALRFNPAYSANNSSSVMASIVSKRSARPAQAASGTPRFWHCTNSSSDVQAPHLAAAMARPPCGASEASAGPGGGGGSWAVAERKHAWQML